MATTGELSKKAADLRAVIDQYLPSPNTRAPIAGLYPDADHVATELMWGGIWNEPGLDNRLRSIATMNAGLTRREICETFAQSGWYRGWPYVEDALEEAMVVFAERGICPIP
jgi:alkylhydroperoxidase/carboxymuconolactone decarboxylase family protein YurZ